MAAIEATGYSPNATARNLRIQSTSMVLCLLPGLGHSFWNVIINAVEEVLTRAKYGVLFGDTRNDPTREAHYDCIVRTGLVDGVLLFNGRLPAADFAKLDSNFPITLISNDIPESGLPVIEIANRDASRQMTEHLIRLGHCRIAHITGPEDNIETNERRRGYMDALAAAGLPINKELIWPGEFSLAAGANVVGRFLDLGDQRPTAVFAASDEMAIGFIRAAKEAGLSVPDDVSVAGFDGIEYSAVYDPRLTTVIQPRTEMGRLGAETLVRRMAGATVERRRTRLPCTLAFRDSVAPPREPKPGPNRRRSAKTGAETTMTSL